MINGKAWRSGKSYLDIAGLKLACLEEGVGDPALFLHGNPTSSYLWRNIIRHISGHARALASDLIGMGDSDKLSDPGPQSYTFAEHRNYLDEAIELLVPSGKLVLVLHDWGSALGFDWANRNRNRVRGICYMEAIVAPLELEDFLEQSRSIFSGFRSSAGQDLILKNNFFIERVLPGSILRQLSDSEMIKYRRPFANPGEDRRPTLTWPRQIPFSGQPADVHDIVESYSQWMAENKLPKLFISAEPWAILYGRLREICFRWKNSD